MKKLSFRILLFVSIISIAIIACSKKGSTPNALPQNITIKPKTTTNGYFSINTQNGFIPFIDDSTITTGSTGNIHKYGTAIGDSIKLNFTFGSEYGGLDLSYYTDTSTIRGHYRNQGDTVVKIETPLINSVFNKTILVTYYVGNDPAKEIEIEFSAFNKDKPMIGNLQIYSQYGLNNEQLTLVKNMLNTIKYFQ